MLPAAPPLPQAQQRKALIADKLQLQGDAHTAAKAAREKVKLQKDALPHAAATAAREVPRKAAQGSEGTGAAQQAAAGETGVLPAAVEVDVDGLFYRWMHGISGGWPG